MTGKTDAKGVITAYQYDALNRLTKIDFGAETDIIYTYDVCGNGKGRLCSVTDQSGNTSYAYSAKGEMTKETKVIQGRTYVTSYQFDKNGNLQQIAYPSGRTVSYALDVADRTISVTTTPAGGSAQTLASSISHKPFGGIASLTYGNGLARTVGYDQQYRINSIVTGAVQNVSYTLDANGNITGITDNLNPTKNKSFGYDALDRLTAGTGPWGSLAWTYDGVGNRQTQVENGATSTYTYQTGTNKLTGVSGPSPLAFSLDSNGNTTSENAKTYTYNQNNRLIKATESWTMKGEYAYSASGQRATKTAGGTTTVYHHDQSGNLIAETTSAGATVAEYIWLESQPLAKIDPGGTRHIHTDHLGTPQVMTSSTGAIVWQIESKPFGETVSLTGTALLNLRFPGQYYDAETGLHQNWFRDYMPKTGRYVEPDRVTVASALYQRALAHRSLRSSLDTDAIVWHYHLLSQKRLRLLTLLWDPERQDPYLSAGNNPLTMVDQNAEFWGPIQVGVEVGVISLVIGLPVYCYITCNQCTSPGNCKNYPNYNDPNDDAVQSTKNWGESNSNCTTACVTGALTIGYNALGTAAKAVGKKIGQCLLGN